MLPRSPDSAPRWRGCEFKTSRCRPRWGYAICAEDERHIIPSNPYKCGICDANKHLRAEVKRLTKRVEWFTHAVHTCHADCDRPLCKTTRERDAFRAENTRLREHIARTANNINVKGGPYDRALGAMEEIMMMLKREARATLAPQERSIAQEKKEEADGK